MPNNYFKTVDDIFGVIVESQKLKDYIKAIVHTLYVEYIKYQNSRNPHPFGPITEEMLCNCLNCYITCSNLNESEPLTVDRIFAKISLVMADLNRRYEIDAISRTSDGCICYEWKINDDTTESIIRYKFKTK